MDRSTFSPLFVSTVIVVFSASSLAPCAAQSSLTISVASLQISDKAWNHYNRAWTASQHDCVAESERESLKAIEIAPTFADAYLLLARTQIREHKYAVALANIQAARDYDPTARWSSTLMAGAYNGLGRFSEARILLSATQGAEAASWQTAYERARAEIGQGDVENALYWSEIALNSAPQRFADAHLVRANALLLAKRWSDAVAQLEQYLQSPQPQSHRQEVLLALEAAKRRIEDDRSMILALR